MLKFGSVRFRPLLLGLLLVGLAGPQAVNASSLTVFKGKYNGKFTGVVVEASGPTGRAIADAATVVKASAKSAKFVISGTLNGVGYKQTIVLRSGRATLSTMIPGGGGNLAKSVTGTFRVRGKNATITVTDPAGFSGRMQVKIGFTTGGSTLIISTVVELGGDPVYSTVTGA